MIYLPLLLVVLNSFNTDRAMTWPPPGLTFEWWQRGLRTAPGARTPCRPASQVAAASTAIALVLGTLLALSLQRYHFFGKTRSTCW